MAIYTPRGLKIRLPVEYAFTLIGRLYPRVSAYKVLKTTEAIESLPNAFAYIVALNSFNDSLSPHQVFFFTFVTFVIGFIVASFDIFLLYIFELAGKIYSYLSGYFILYIIIVSYGYYASGWTGVLAYLLAVLLGELVKMGSEIIISKIRKSQKKRILTTSEFSFLNAYRFYAYKLAISRSVKVSENEIKSGKWQLPFSDLQAKWPEVTRRFSTEPFGSKYTSYWEPFIHGFRSWFDSYRGRY